MTTFIMAPQGILYLPMADNHDNIRSPFNNSSHFAVGTPATLKSSDHWSRGKREIIIKTVMASLSFCKRSPGRISNTKISNI
jgi:hypothetical protein